MWPVIHPWLGVSPDLGRGRVAVVPQLPPEQRTAAVRAVRLGTGSVDVTARRDGRRYVTTVTRHGRVALTIGATVPIGTRIRAATLDGHRTKVDLVQTSRGLEVVTVVRAGQGRSQLVVTTD